MSFHSHSVPPLLTSHDRFLAIVLPTLTLCTHTLLAFSFALPGSEQYRAFWSLVYNSLAACASILGLIGAVRVSIRPTASPCFTRTAFRP